MSFISRLWKQPPPAIPFAPDDNHIRQELKAAKKENSLAVSSFVEASQKQGRAAEHAGYVIQELLHRADNVKAVNHAGNKE